MVKEVSAFSVQERRQCEQYLFGFTWKKACSLGCRIGFGCVLACDVLDGNFGDIPRDIALIGAAHDLTRVIGNTISVMQKCLRQPTEKLTLSQAAHEVTEGTLTQFLSDPLLKGYLRKTLEPVAKLQHPAKSRF